MHLFNENIKIDCSLPVMETYRTAGTANGAGVDMAKYHNFAAVISAASATQWQGNLACYIAESTDNTTYSTVYLATKTVSSNTTTDQVAVIEVSDSKMTPGYRYLRLTVIPVGGTGNMYAAINTRFNPRYAAVSN